MPNMPPDSVAIDLSKQDPCETLSSTLKNSKDQHRPEFELQWSLSLSVAITDIDSTKTILDRACGVARPGEVLAIMGPSGAGKTSLLNCLSGRNKAHDGSVVLVDEKGKRFKWSKSMKRITAYVQQDDLMLATITPREHLLFQAALQMDQTKTPEELAEHVDSVLESLNLTKCADTMIGDPSFVRGISGGERKRVSFAAQLLGDPSILFVDEPTSGLDSHMAEEVVLYLARMAKTTGRKRTIITTIHQPTSHAFAQFDQLLLLSDGRGVFLGPATDAVSHFAQFGPEMACPQYMNPSDFFLHVLGVKAFREQRDAMCDTYNLKWPVATEQKSDPVENAEQDEGKMYTATCWSQFQHLSWRNWVCRIRNPRETHLMFVLTLFFAIVMGLVYFQLDKSQKGVQSVNGVLFMSLMQMSMQQMTPTIQVFAADLPMYMREHKSGQYSMTALFLSKMLGDLPFQLLVPVIYSAPLYFLVGLPIEANVYLKWMLVIVLTANAAASVGYLLGCGSPSAAFAMMVQPMVLMPNLLLSGFMINLDNIPVYMRPLSYISFLRYGMSAQLVNIWTSSSYDQIPCSAEELADDQCLFKNGEDVLNYNSVDGDTYWHNLLILSCLNVLLRTLAYAALRLRARKFQTATN